MFFPSVLPFLGKTLPHFSPSLPALFTQPSSPGLSQAEGPSLHSLSLLLRGCLSLLLLHFSSSAALFLLCCSRCLSLPSPSATTALGDGTQTSLPTLPGHPGALAAPNTSETRWSGLPAASVSPSVQQGSMAAGGERDRLDTFVAPHNQNCSHSVVLPSQACPRLIPDLLTHPHGYGAAHSWVQVAPFQGTHRSGMPRGGW